MLPINQKQEHTGSYYAATVNETTDYPVLESAETADVCVIDPECIQLDPVEVRHDLPGDAPRLHQVGRGYRAVLVNGGLAVRDDEPLLERHGEMIDAHPC